MTKFELILIPWEFVYVNVLPTAVLSLAVTDKQKFQAQLISYLSYVVAGVRWNPPLPLPEVNEMVTGVLQFIFNESMK